MTSSRRGGKEIPWNLGRGDRVCSLCGKTGLTELGLKLHTARKHKGEKGKAAA